MASQIVPAGKPVQLRVRASGLDNGEPASFEIVRRSDGEQLATVQGKVVDGFATGEWTPEGPAAEEEVQEWDLAFTVKCAGLETKAAPLKVYTDWVEVKCVDDEDHRLPPPRLQRTVLQTSRLAVSRERRPWLAVRLAP